jgi:hypothetical protein
MLFGHEIYFQSNWIFLKRIGEKLGSVIHYTPFCGTNFGLEGSETGGYGHGFEFLSFFFLLLLLTEGSSVITLNEDGCVLRRHDLIFAILK